LFHLDTNNVYRSHELARFNWIEHGFGTRLSSRWPDCESLATLRQIHSDQVLVAESAGLAGEGDALLCSQPGTYLAIRTADCLPILVVDPRQRAVAAIHAGWRGAVQEIASKAIQAMQKRFESRPEDLVIAIGAGIGACCFEVGPEVASQFRPFFPERDDLSARAKVDLGETVIRQLRRNGVSEGQIVRSGLCTCCYPLQFESYRRDREASGRMISVIGIRTA
jgi:polyphenol oxidase